MGWTLTVEDFGRIERAQVDVRPLMLFVGDNSSGKSYLASLLWGVVAMQMDVDLRASPRYPACLSWAAERIKPGAGPLDCTLTPDEVRMFAALFEDAFERSAKHIVKGVFNAATPSAKSVSFRATDAGPVGLAWEYDAVKNRHKLTIKDSQPLPTEREGSHEEARAIAVDALARRICFGKLFRLFAPLDDTYKSIDPIYMPASRTGFMLLYKSVVSKSLEREYLGTPGGGALSELTRPAFHFLKWLTNSDHRSATDRASEEKFPEEAAMLERAVGGRIEVVQPDSGIQDYRYRMTGSTETLAMSHSSSLVTEVAPILLLLRQRKRFPLLVLEEPEAHLHPRLQRALAGVVARLVNRGVHVWITTHSTTFCQQINNLIKLGSLPAERAADARARWGYVEEEALNLGKVAGYQFVIREDDDRTQVTELRKTERGLVMPSFNRDMVRLGEEIDDLDMRLAEEAE